MNDFFRLVLKKKNENFYFLCGGTLSEVQQYVEETEFGEATKKFIAQIAGQILGAALSGKQLEQNYWVGQFSEGLVAQLYNMGKVEDGTT